MENDRRDKEKPQENVWRRLQKWNILGEKFPKLPRIEVGNRMSVAYALIIDDDDDI